MPDYKDQYLPFWEWELLRDHLEVTNLVDKGDLHPATERIVLSRVEDYSIALKLTGKNASPVSLKSKPTPKRGEEYKPKEVVGTGLDGSIIKVIGAVVPGLRIKPDGELSGEGSAFQVVVDYQTGKASQTRSLWCLNGPDDMIPWRSTRRTSGKDVKRERESMTGDGELKQSWKGTTFSSSAADHWRLKVGGDEVILGQVPSEFGPNWSKNMSVEFRTLSTWCRQKDGEKGLLEGLSFIVGKRLIPIGSTDYFDGSHPVSQTAVKAWGLNLKAECSNPADPPINLQANDTFTELDPIGSSIVTKYLDLRDEFSLSETIWMYWLSKIVPLGSGLVYLSASLENLMNACYHSVKSKSKGAYLDTDTWNGFLKAPLELLENNLGQTKYADRILGRVKRANALGVNEKFEFFFEEIGLPIGDVERAAIKSRNVFAHGGNLDLRKIELVVEATSAFKVLINRALLKMFGYTGKYIDYSTLGFPERDLDQPLGGSDGSGKPIRTK